MYQGNEMTALNKYIITDSIDIQQSIHSCLNQTKFRLSLLGADGSAAANDLLVCSQAGLHFSLAITTMFLICYSFVHANWFQRFIQLFFLWLAGWLGFLDGFYHDHVILQTPAANDYKTEFAIWIQIHSWLKYCTFTEFGDIYVSAVRVTKSGSSSVVIIVRDTQV